MNVAFAGTPEFAAAILKALCAHTHISCVYTQPDRPKGRGRKLSASAVKQYALDNHLTLFQPSTLNEKEADYLAQVDVMIVVAYGQILPKAILNAPKYGCINIHTSLLPRWRGAAPIERSILAGDTQTGISLIQMDEGLDSGDIIAQTPCLIESNDSPQTLRDKLLTLAKTLIIDTIKRLPQQTTAQATQGITYAHKLTKNEAWINWQHSAEQINRHIRAFNPYPIAQCYADSNRFSAAIVRILSAELIDTNDTPHSIGSVINQSKQGIDVACRNGVIRLQTLQLAGKKPLSAADFINAYHLSKLF